MCERPPHAISKKKKLNKKRKAQNIFDIIIFLRSGSRWVFVIRWLHHKWLCMWSKSLTIFPFFFCKCHLFSFKPLCLFVSIFHQGDYYYYYNAVIFLSMLFGRLILFFFSFCRLISPITIAFGIRHCILRYKAWMNKRKKKYFLKKNDSNACVSYLFLWSWTFFFCFFGMLHTRVHFLVQYFVSSNSISTSSKNKKKKTVIVWTIFFFEWEKELEVKKNRKIHLLYGISE